MNKELEAINLTLDLMERLIQPTIFEGLKSDLNAIDFKLNRLSKLDKLLELYHKLLKYIGLYNASTYCTKETLKDLEQKVKATQNEIKAIRGGTEMTALEHLNKIGLMTTKRNLQDFPIGNQPKQIVKMKIKEMPEFQEVVNSLTDYEQLQRDVKRFMELDYQAKMGDGIDDTEAVEYTRLSIKLMKVGK